MCLGTLGVVTRIWDEGGIPMAAVRDDRGEQPVCLLYAPHAAVGDDVLVHLGYVLDVIDPRTAADARHLRAGTDAERDRH